jgi:DNA-binding transcriptional regulator YiaG
MSSTPDAIIIVALTFIYAALRRGARRKITVTMIACKAAEPPVAALAVDNEPLQVRAKRAGLQQKRLAALLGVSENTVSLQLRGKWESGTPRYVTATIIAWEIMSHADRMRWLEETEALAADLKRRSR